MIIIIIIIIITIISLIIIIKKLNKSVVYSNTGQLDFCN